MATYKTINLSPSNVSVISNSVGYISGSERIPLNNLLHKYAGKYTTKFIFPIGFILESTDVDFNPNDIYDGKWEEYGQGRTLIGVDGPENVNIGLTVGTYSHVLTTSEMASHSHALGTSGAVNYRGSKEWDVGQKTTPSGQYTNQTGGGQAHNNIQPYILCYRWRRVE